MQDLHATWSVWLAVPGVVLFAIFSWWYVRTAKKAGKKRYGKLH
jgi:hypothetical protein